MTAHFLHQLYEFTARTLFWVFFCAILVEMISKFLSLMGWHSPNYPTADSKSQDGLNAPEQFHQTANKLEKDENLLAYMDRGLALMDTLFDEPWKVTRNTALVIHAIMTNHFQTDNRLFMGIDAILVLARILTATHLAIPSRDRPKVVAIWYTMWKMGRFNKDSSIDDVKVAHEIAKLFTSDNPTTNDTVPSTEKPRLLKGEAKYSFALDMLRIVIESATDMHDEMGNELEVWKAACALTTLEMDRHTGAEEKTAILDTANKEAAERFARFLSSLEGHIEWLRRTEADVLGLIRGLDRVKKLGPEGRVKEHLDEGEVKDGEADNGGARE